MEYTYMLDWCILASTSHRFQRKHFGHWDGSVNMFFSVSYRGGLLGLGFHEFLVQCFRKNLSCFVRVLG